MKCGIDVQSPNINDASFQMRQIAALMNAAGRISMPPRRMVEGGCSVHVFGRQLFRSSIRFSADGRSRRGCGWIERLFPARPVTSPELADARKSSFCTAILPVARGKICTFHQPLTGTVTIPRYVSRNWLVGRDKINSNADVPVFT